MVSSWSTYQFELGPTYAEAERNYKKQEELNEEARKKSRELLVRLIGEKLVKVMEDGYGVRIRSQVDGSFEYEICFDEIELHHACNIMGVKIRPLRWDLCVETTDETLNRYDKAYTIITMLKANEREFVKTANFNAAETEDESMTRG